jgi:hypothetical protein
MVVQEALAFILVSSVKAAKEQIKDKGARDGL